MGRVAELYADIEEQLVMGAKPEEISKHFKVPLRIVHEVQEDLHSQMNYSNTSDYDNTYASY